jgi:hypothetical protein
VPGPAAGKEALSDQPEEKTMMLTRQGDVDGLAGVLVVQADGCDERHHEKRRLRIHDRTRAPVLHCWQGAGNPALHGGHSGNRVFDKNSLFTKISDGMGVDKRGIKRREGIARRASSGG